MARLRVVLFQALPNFGCGISNDRIRTRVIFRRPPEHRDTQCPLLQFITGATKRLLDDVPQERRIPLAVLEKGSGQNTLQLL